MECLEIYGIYQNQIIEVYFKEDSDAIKEFGQKLVGYFLYPTSFDHPFYVNEQIGENQTQKKLARLCFKITPGFKLRNNISDAKEKQINDLGFACSDVKVIVRPNEFYLEVSGNANYSKQDIKPIKYMVGGYWGMNKQNALVTYNKEGFPAIAMYGNQFYNLCMRLRDCSFKEIHNILIERNIDFKLHGVSLEELDLIKALANLFIWLEYYFLEEEVSFDPSKLVNNDEFLPKMYNDFVTDAHIYPGNKLRDIYLLPKNIPFGSNELNKLEELCNINLLSRVILKTRGQTFTNYFIPFTKIDDWRSLLEKQEDLISLYQRILNERNICLSNFYKNR